jgi:hypothetical protein
LNITFLCGGGLLGKKIKYDFLNICADLSDRYNKGVLLLFPLPLPQVTLAMYDERMQYAMMWFLAPELLAVFGLIGL